MDCQQCGRTNRSGAKFCAGCAASLGGRCSSCGHGIQADASFCDQCGAAVDRSNPRALDDDPVRKTVTVLFCDLVGSTALGERVDAETARETMASYHALAQRIVRAHGGDVAKFIGDGVMAMFGVPEVAVDDAARAVTTGLELQRSFLAIADAIADRHGVDVGLRVGINTGEVVIAESDVDVVGDVLNTAARLEGACPPGDVLVGEPTWRLTRSSIRYETFGDLELRGKRHAVASFRAVGEVEPDEHSPVPFIGREAELRQLETVYRDAVDATALRVATVIGAPGVGKTQLTRELMRSIDGSPLTVEVRCERVGTTTFAPVADLLRQIADIDDSMDASDAVGAIREVVRDLPEADRLARLLGSFVGADTQRSTEELFFAVRRLFETVGGQRPFIVVIDDLQWAEPLMFDLIEHLADWVRNATVLVIGLARPELRDIRQTLTEAGGLVTDAISLGGLDATATAELAARIVGADSLPADLASRLPESTQGNPLFVRELMTMLVDDGVIEEADGTWDLTIDVDAVDVPPTIQSLLSTRIERMPPDERRFLEHASVIGLDFTLRAVRAIGGGEVDELRSTLGHLRRKELVAPTGTQWDNEPLFRFHHALIRDAAYRRLLKRRRAELHLSAARWTEATSADVVGEHEVTIGYHLEQAHDYRDQLGLHDDETEALGRRAAELFEIAARRALDREDVAAAGSLARRAVDRLAPDDERTPELLMLECEALLALGDVESTREPLAELAARSGHDARLLAWAACFESQLVLLTEPDRLDAVDADAATAARQLAGLDDHPGEAKARLVRAGALARLGRIGECEAELDLALIAARRGEDGRRVAAVLAFAPVAALWGPSPVSRARARCIDVIRVMRATTGSPRVEATSTRCQAVLEALRTDYATARSMLDAASATVEELGLRHDLLETELYRGIVELLAGEPGAAEPYLRTAYGGLGRLGIGADAGQAEAYLARALLLQGRLEEAEALASDSDAHAGQNPQTAVVSRTARAEILAARGQLVDARHLAETAVQIAAGTDIVIDAATANLTLARVRLATGDVDGAVAAGDTGIQLLEDKGAIVELGDLRDVGGVPTATANGATGDGDAITFEPTTPHSEPWNDADGFVRVHLAAGGDEARWRVALSNSIEVHDHRQSGNASHIGVETVLDAFPHGLAPGCRFRPLATRGDQLVLLDTFGTGPNGNAAGALLLQMWTSAGELQRVEFFDPDGLADAIAQLDRLYLATAAMGLDRHRFRRLAAALTALTAGDPEPHPGGARRVRRTRRPPPTRNHGRHRGTPTAGRRPRRRGDKAAAPPRTDSRRSTDGDVGRTARARERSSRSRWPRRFPPRSRDRPRERSGRSDRPVRRSPRRCRPRPIRRGEARPRRPRRPLERGGSGGPGGELLRPPRSQPRRQRVILDVVRGRRRAGPNPSRHGAVPRDGDPR